MEVLQDGVLAFLAATGLAALFWLLTAVPIVLCDCGLEGADLRRARELTERYDDLLLLTAAEIPDHLP